MSVRKDFFAGLAGVALCLALTGCNSAAPETTAAIPVAAAVPEPPAPGVVGAAIGQSLDEKDKTAAIAAQQAAFASGARKTWRGAHGAYGFVIPAAESGGCRDYTHKIYIDGRPQEAKGHACRKGEDWRADS